MSSLNSLFGRARSSLSRAIAGRVPPYPPPEGGVVIYAVGDIHGRLDCLEGVQELIDEEGKRSSDREAVEVYLGDYVDRGPQSGGVIDRLISRRLRARCIFLRGNHERALTDFLEGRMPLDAWRNLGGLETAMSYGVDPKSLIAAGVSAGAMLLEAMPPSHHDFLSTLITSYRAGPYFFAHAGVRPGVPLDRQSEEDLLWIRNEFLDSGDDFGAIVVHGHTPTGEPEFRRNRINIDTGAYATGNLTCIRLGGDGLRRLVRIAS